MRIQWSVLPLSFLFVFPLNRKKKAYEASPGRHVVLTECLHLPSLPLRRQMRTVSFAKPTQWKKVVLQGVMVLSWLYPKCRALQPGWQNERLGWFRLVAHVTLQQDKKDRSSLPARKDIIMCYCGWEWSLKQHYVVFRIAASKSFWRYINW